MAYGNSPGEGLRGLTMEKKKKDPNIVLSDLVGELCRAWGGKGSSGDGWVRLNSTLSQTKERRKEARKDRTRATCPQYDK